MIELKAALAERTSDLQRLQAEYVNYKRRVDRDRDLSRKVTIEGVLKDFLSVLDDVRSAREHDELSGGFKAVAEEIERVTSKYGLETFGEPGDPFNPHIHEHCCTRTLKASTDRPAWRSAARVPNRRSHSAAARVAVAEPEPKPMRPEPVEGPSTSSGPMSVAEPSSSPTDESVGDSRAGDR